MKFLHSLAFQIALALVALVTLMLAGTVALVSYRIHEDLGALTVQSNLQITAARGGELGKLLRLVEWQLLPMAEWPAFRSGDARQTHPAVEGLKGHLPPEVLQVLWADPKGAYVTSAGAQGNISDRNYFQAVVQQGADRFLSEAVVSKSLGVPIVVYAIPVRGDDGKVNGLLGAMVSLSSLSAIAADIKVGRSGYGWIIDKTGLMLAHPRAEAIMKLNVTDADKTGYRGLDALGAEMIRGKPGVGRFFHEGVEYLTFFSPIPESPGWMLGISLPVAEAELTETSLRTVLLINLAVGVLLVLAVSLILGRQLVRPLQLTAQSFRRLAEGEADLTLHLAVRRKDEIGLLVNDFNAFLAKLRQIVQGIQGAQASLTAIGGELSRSSTASRAAVTQIGQSVALVDEQAQGQHTSVNESASAVEEIAKNIESLDQLISHLAANISEASASVEEMVGNISSIGDSAARMSQEFGDLSRVADHGRETHAQAMTRVEAIVEQSKALLEANSVIAGIASQTNLLAMNAAIEAAHAGEAGRGFSVVADEIRRLAETSSVQSRSIGKDLKTIQAAIVEALGSSRESEEAFERISQKIVETEALVRSVREALAEQKEGSTQTLLALRDMNQVSAEVQSGSQEMRSGNQTILAEIDRLRSGTSAIASTVARIEGEARGIDAASLEVQNLASRTSQTIEELDALVGRFRT